MDENKVKILVEIDMETNLTAVEYEGSLISILSAIGLLIFKLSKTSCMSELEIIKALKFVAKKRIAEIEEN